MNICSEYCFLPDGAVLPDESIKVLGIHAEGFYFLIHKDNEVLYAGLGSFRNGISEEAIKGILNIKPSWKISGFDRIVIQPLSFAAVTNEILLDISEKELFQMVDVLPDTCRIIKTKLDKSDSGLLSAYYIEDLNILSQFVLHNNEIEDVVGTWFNKLKSNGKENIAHLLVFPSSFVIAVFSKEKLHLINSFSYSDKNSFLYYLLGAVKSCNINPENTDLMVCGEISKSSILTNAVAPYFSGIDFNSIENKSNEESTVKITSLLYPLF